MVSPIFRAYLVLHKTYLAMVLIAATLLGAFSAPAMAQNLTYSENFVAGVSNDPGSPQVDNWEAFRDNLTGTYSSITVGGTQGPDVTCSDPAALASLATALNTDATASISCNGRTWNTGTCIGTNELSIDTAICVCAAASPFTLRPDVDAGGAAWGGIGGTCGPAGPGAVPNVNQTLSVTAVEFIPLTVPDLSLRSFPASLSPSRGSNTFIDIEIENESPVSATGVTVDVQLPSGLTYVSDDSGGSYNSGTGIWSPGTVFGNTSQRLRIIAEVQFTGSFTFTSEVATANEPDNDSTPGNASTVPGEDDSDRVTLLPVTPPAPLFCLGRPIQPLVFLNPIAESPGANLLNPQVGDIFRFPNISTGVDALVQIMAFNNGASLLGIDNDGTLVAPVGVPDNFQPTLLAPAAGDASVDFQITVVATGTSIPGTLDFAGSAIDVDGNGFGNGLREYIEVSNNIVEFALNGVTPPSPATRLVTLANTPPDAGASASSTSSRVRFEAATDEVAPSIDPNEPRNIVAAFFTDVSVFEYRIGKLGAGTAGTGRLNSLAFNCPAINPGTGGAATVVDEDFGDVPFDPNTNPGYGNPIHVINSNNPVVQLGSVNTGDPAAGNSPDASSDAGDDGVTVGGTSLQGQSFQGLVARTLEVAVTNTSPDTGRLQAFFDWNRDGDFDDAGEQVASDTEDGDSDGTITLNITPPVEIVAGVSFARFRWATSSVGVQDPASDGEVEDYQITLVAPILALDKTASMSSVSEGASVIFTLSVTETAGVDTSNLVVTDNVPAGFSIVSIANGGLQSGNTITWTASGPLNANATAGQSFSFVARANSVAADTPLTNIGSAVSDQVQIPVTDNETVTVIDTPQITCPVGDTSTGSGFANSGTGAFVADIFWFDWSCGGTSTYLAGNTATKTWALPGGIVVTGVLSNVTEGLVPEDTTAVSSNILDDLYGGVNPIGLRGQASSTNPEFVLSFSAIQGAVPLDLEYVVADAETTGPNEFLEVITTGTPFTLIETNGGSTLVGNGTTTVVFNGNAQPGTSLVTSFGAPSFSNTLNQGNGSLQALAYGVRLNLPNGELSGTKTVEVFDPLGEGLFVLPGSDVTYIITVQNVGDGQIDQDTIFMIDELPPEVTFFNGDADGPGPGVDPVNFETIVATGLDPFVFGDSVAFAGVGPAPTSFADCTLAVGLGYDPNVRYVCFNPKGIMDAGDPDPAFEFSFRVRVR